MKHFACLIALLVFCFVISSAQSYRSSFGLRVGSANGVSWQQFYGKGGMGSELMLVYRRGGLRSIGMISYQIPLGYRSSTSIYLGIGGHAGANGGLEAETPWQPVFGVDAMIGIQYEFPYSPWALSFDLKPMVELYRQRSFSGNNAGVSLRYLIQ